jgi:glycosyltransferase involved in cell wall biosynthesis
MTILYCYVNSSSFVIKDQEILETEHDVITVSTGRLKRSGIISSLLKQAWSILKRIRKCDLVIVSGAGHHSLFPALISKLFGRPCYITIIGVDGSKFPGIGYGNFSKQPLNFITTASLKLATELWPIHDSLRYQDYSYSEDGGAKQGYEAFIPDLRTPSLVINRGYDSELWRPTHEFRVKHRFLTVVSFFNSPSIVPLKGLDLILDIAPEFPDCEFHIAGLTGENFGNDVPENITFLGPIPHKEMPSIFGSATYYFQLSMSEGFGNSLCESMLCECVPIGSSVNAIPTIIGDSGFLLEKKSPEALISLVKKALNSDTKTIGTKARSRIKTMYRKDRRTVELLRAVRKD